MSLARSGEPLKLADGRVVYPGGDIADPRKPVDVDTRIETTTRPKIRRKVGDLPATPRQMNAIGAVFSYVMFGLDDDEVASATGLGVDQVAQIRNSDPYKHLHEAVIRSVLDCESDTVREVFTRNARHAATTMVEALQSGTRADRMAAARDILDRSGHRPADVVEHRHRMDGGLVIEVVKRDSVQIPTIDMGSV